MPTELQNIARGSGTQAQEAEEKLPSNPLGEAISWSKTRNPEFPYITVIAGAALRVRLNNFPAESLYTLIINGEDVADFDEWPEQWSRPA